jgi:hypothetical protein
LRIQGDPSAMPPADKADDANRSAKPRGRAQARHQDIVEISDDARQLIAGPACRSGRADSAGRPRDALPRITVEVKDRILGDFYDNEEVLRQIAGRILDQWNL